MWFWMGLSGESLRLSLASANSCPSASWLRTTVANFYMRYKRERFLHQIPVTHAAANELKDRFAQSFAD